MNVLPKDPIKQPALYIVLVYIVFGSLWILFSDKILLYFVNDLPTYTRLQTYKGWFFVLASGGLIFTLMNVARHHIRKREKDLRDSETLQRNFLNTHYQPLWKSDKMGYSLFVNEQWNSFTAFEMDATRAFPWLELVHQDDKPHCIDRFSQGYINRRLFELEYRMKISTGEFHWVLNTCVPYHDSSGNFMGFVGFYSDIQEKKHLQERYKDSSKRYGYLFANNPQAMLIYDNQDFRILEVNKAVLSLYGYSEKEFLSLTIIDLRPSTEIPALMEHLSEQLPEFHRSSGWIHKRKDGSLFDAEITAHSLPSAGSRTMRLVIIRDITDQIRAFRSAREGERRFKAIFNFSPQGAIICDENLKVRDINPAACHLLDTEPSVITETPFEKVIGISNPGLRHDFLKNLLDTAPGSGEITLKRNSGPDFRATYSSIMFFENGLQRLYFSFNDIDEKHKMQTALQESERINATLVTNLPGMVYRCRFDESWTMTYLSYGVEDLTGYKISELLNNNDVSYAEIIYPDDKARVFETVHKAVAENKKFEIQYRISSKNKKIKWVWEQAQGIYNDVNQFIYVEGFIMDITREKEAMDEVEFQSIFLSLIMDNIPFPLFYKNSKGEYTGCNMAFCTYMNKPKDDIVGKTAIDLFAPEQARVFFKKIRNC